MTMPIGGMGASATDMARFMIAHLQNGRYSDANIAEARILNEATAQQMHSTLFTHDPRLLGTAYGFFDFSDNGQLTLGHSGEAEPMHSLMLLLPERNLGVFVTFNSQDAAALTNQHFGFQRAFFDHYFPAPEVQPIQAPVDFAGRAGRFEGAYRMTNVGSYTTLEKVLVLMGASVEIKHAGDGTLLLATPWDELRLVEVEPLYFRQVDGPFAIVFREDGRGRITHMVTDLTPMLAFEKLNWYETTDFNLALLLACIVMFLSIIPIAAIHFLRNLRSSGDRTPGPRSPRVAYSIILGICVLNLLFLAGTLRWGNPVPVYGVSVIYQIVLGLGVLSALLTAVALAYAVLSWKNRFWSIAGRIYYTLVTIAATAFFWFLNYWNLLGWRF
jgi:hypothetical protein